MSVKPNLNLSFIWKNFNFMMNIKKIILTLLFFLVFNSTSAYCPPLAQIDSIKNGKECLSIKATSSCGGEVKIINNCQEEFYFYDRNKNLDENFILINNEEWSRNYQKYQDLEKETGRNYSGNRFISVGNEYLGKEYWMFKVFSKKDNQDIVVKGGFKETTNSINMPSTILFILAVSWFLFLTVFILKKIWKKVFAKN